MAYMLQRNICCSGIYVATVYMCNSIYVATVYMYNSIYVATGYMCNEIYVVTAYRELLLIKKCVVALKLLRIFFNHIIFKSYN